MQMPSAATASLGPPPRRRRTASVAWQLALAQEFGGAFPFEWNASSGQVVASAGLKGLIGLRPGADLTASHVLEHVVPDDRARLTEDAEEAIRAGTRFESEFRFALADGRRIWVLARGRAIGRGRHGRIAGVALDITRRKAAECALAQKEAALLESEARFRGAQESSLDGFVMLESVRDLEGGLVDFQWTYANAAAERILGRPRESLIGRSLLAEMPGTREEGLYDAYARVVETGEPWNGEFFYRHDGLDVYLRVVAGRAGDGVAVTFADLSERRRAEEKVIAAEERWRSILNTIPQMVWSAQPDGSHDFFNDRWYEFTGTEPGSSDGDGWIALFHPEERARITARWQLSLQTGEPYEIEYRMRDRDGRWRWTLGRALPLRNGGGAIERWFGTCTDIDDFKTAEARLQVSEERLQLALNAAEVVGTWDWDLSSDVIAADPRFARLFGICPARAEAGLPLESFLAGIHPDDRERVAGSISRAVLTGERYVEEYRLRRPDGSEIWVSARGQCVWENGRAVRFPGAAFDVTERKAIEEARELLASELSHRIKNIFAVINSLVTLSARGHPEAGAYAEALRARLTALGRAHDYVQPLPAALKPADESAVQTAHGLFEALLAPYQAEVGGRIVVDGCDARVGVRAATALALIVHELATNAVKYGALSTESGSVTLSCSEGEDGYRMHWRESGGPRLDGPPPRQGFGSRMSQRTATLQLRANVEHAWDVDGLAVTIVLPLAELAR